MPSGQGLIPADAGYDGSFKDSMQKMIDLVKNAGSNQQPYLAKVPFFLNTTSARIALIQEYNQVIDQLVLDNSIPVTPPDMYSHFESNQNEFADDVHPNGVGYQSMATLWANEL